MLGRISRYWILALVAGIFALALPGDTYAGPTTATSAPEADQVDAGLQARLDRHTAQLRFNGNAFVDVLDFLRGISGINIYVDWKSLLVAGVTPDMPVTYSAHDIACRDALDAILADLTSTEPVGFHPVSNFIVITTDSGMDAFRKLRASHPQKIGSAKLQAKLDKHLAELRFNANSLSDVVDFLRDISAARIYVDWTSFKAAGISTNAPVDQKLRDVSLWDSLDMIFSQVSAEKATIVYSDNGEILNISAVATKKTP